MFVCTFIGKIELLFMKVEPNLWTTYGSMEKEKIGELENKVYEYDVQGREELTHDSCALLLKSKDKVQMITPVGYHINITANVNGMCVCDVFKNFNKTVKIFV